MCDNCMKNGQADESLRAYYHGCPGCGAVPDEDGECECPPEDYIKPGNDAIVYVNAYEVDRRYGGCEEGGWYYNHYEPIASIPVLAVSVAGHANGCHQCYMARQGETLPSTGEKYELCKWGFELEPKDPAQVEAFKAHLEALYGPRREGNIYSVLGGTEIHIIVEDHVGERTPRPHYE